MGCDILCRETPPVHSRYHILIAVETPARTRVRSTTVTSRVGSHGKTDARQYATNRDEHEI